MMTPLSTVWKGIWMGAVIALFVFAPLSCHSLLTRGISSTFLQTAQADTGATAYQATQQMTAALQEDAKQTGGAPQEESNWIAQAIKNMIGRSMLALGAGVLYLGGLIFDKAFLELVVNFSTNATGQLGSTLTTTWTLIRDVCNLAFIFGFIYVGIMTILVPDNASPKKFLGNLIICAILINFSLYLAQVIIDISNFLAVEIYNGIIGKIGNDSISAAILKLIGVDSAWKLDPTSLMNLVQDNTSFFYYIGATLFLLVAGLVLGIIGFLMVTRFVELIIIMIFSPIYFGARVFPQTASYSKQIMTKLISSAFFAPIFLFLLFISLAIANSLVTPLEGSGAGFAKLMLDGAKSTQITKDSMTIVINYIIIILLLWSSLSLAKKLGVTGGQMAINIGQNVKGRAQRFLGGATFGMGARLGRATAGRLAQGAVKSDKLKDFASQKGWRGVVGRTALRSSVAVGDASFDARNINGLGKKTGLGEGKKGGYKTRQEEIEKKEAAFGKLLGTVDDTDIRVEARKKEMETAKTVLDADGRRLKKAMAEEQDPNKRLKMQEDLNKLEKNYNDAKINYEKEKQRRILGSTFDDERSDSVKLEVYKKKQKLDLKKEEIKKKWKGDPASGTRAYADPTLSNEDKATRRKEIAELNKQLSELESDLRKYQNAQGDQGYASVLEDRSHLSSWIKGRLNAQDRAAGKEMRKTAEKGLPKEKEASKTIEKEAPKERGGKEE